MALEILIPETGKEKKTKDMIFSILVDNPYLTLTLLQKKIKSLYGITITLQSIIKAINSLLENKVILKENKKYFINKEWVLDVKNYFDNLYFDVLNINNLNRKINYSKNVSIYFLDNLFELDRLWSDFLINWIEKEKKDKRNVWQGKHCWWLIPRIQNEELLHDQFDRYNVKTYNLISRNTLLDKLAYNYYTSRKESVKIIKKDIAEDISCFGDYVFKYKIPTQIYIKLEEIYLSTKSVDRLDINSINKVFKEKGEIEVTIIKDNFLADKIKTDIINQFK